MTKENFIDLIILNLTNGDPTADAKKKYHPEEVGKYIEIIYDEYIRQVCVAGQETGDMSGLDSFTKAFKNLPVVKEIDREEYYVVLPIPVVQLPEFLGIRQVSPMKAPGTNFRYTQYMQQAVMSHLDVAQVDTAVKYYVENGSEGENDRIYFWQGFDFGTYTEVLARLVVPYSQLNDRSEIAIPAGKAATIANAVKSLMEGRKDRRIDLINQNNPTA